MDNPFGKRFGRYEIDRETKAKQAEVDAAELELEDAKDRLADEGAGDTPDDDVVTSIQEEIDELESRLAELHDDLEELEELQGLDGEDYIEESEFEKHAQELAEDIEGRRMFNRWPFTCIDWERAADELRQDYSSTTVFGEDYLYRS